MTALQVQAFGRLRLQHDGHVVTSFPTHHVEELLAYLLLNPQVRHSREKLITILWPESQPEKARGRFSTTLWRLRAVLDDLGLPAQTYLQTSRDWVALVPAEPIQMDLYQFEECLTRARFATDAGHEQALSAAVCIYRGELLEGIYADWCLLERERLARLHLRALGQLMAGCMQRQAYAEAVDLGQAIVQEDPLREEVHRAIMHCYRHMGLPAQAARQFHLCAQGLMEELQVLPMPETISLYQQIIAERLQQAQAKTTPASPLQGQLKAAFAEFQRAGRKLNSLLHAAE